MKMWKKLKFITALLLMISITVPLIGEPVLAETDAAAETGVTVYTADEFMNALAQKKSPIIIGSGLITVGDQADSTGRMLPIMIPKGTVIRGERLDCQLNFRAPMQIEGDGVVIEDMKVVFESSDALGSVPHREIFLAGHSLTLDNVSTYLKGGGGDWGSLGGSEEELLPTVYGGGYPGTSIGTQASLTLQNSNEETMFKGIYMGNTDENGDKEPYLGAARLQFDTAVIVREGIHTEKNSLAAIDLNGEGSAKTKEFYGNDQTVFTIRQSEISDAVINNVGSIVLDNGAWLTPQSDTLKNVTVKNGSCLDFSHVGEGYVTGDFSGDEGDGKDGTGILVLKEEGCLTILGNVTGKTQFQTGHKFFPGTLVSQKGYIIAERNQPEDMPFVLSQKNLDEGFELIYDDGVWRAYRDGEEEFFEIGSIEIPYAKTEVDLSRIMEQTDEEMFCKIVWRDKSGQIIGDDEIDIELPYTFGYVFLIKTDYWESEDASVQEETIWGNAIMLERSLAHPENYLMYAFPGAKSGKYTFLFCSEYIEDELITVADVKAKKDFVKAEMCVNFYDSSKGEEPPAHQHFYYGQITKEPSCTETGIKTFYCSGCGDTYTQIIAETGHTEVIDPAEEATCAKEGKTQGSHCSVCNTVITAQDVIPKTDHTEVIDPAEEATCAKEGKTQGSHCSVCNTVITAQDVIPKTDHTEVIDPAEEATCAQDGKTQGSHCSVCNKIIKIQQIIPKKAHKYQTQTIKASVDKNGYSRTECIQCGKVFEEYVIDSPKSIELSFDSYVYDGMQKTPSVIVRDKNGRIIHSEYYTVDVRNNKDVGLAEVRVTFWGNYEGVLTGTFQILPKPAAMKNLKAERRGFTVKWKKQTSQITGYMIQYSLNKKFAPKSTKQITVGNRKASSKKVKKLKAGKKYFVRICTYKEVNAGGTTVNLCSDWSKAKKVKVK